jgi:hypothetical protein
LRPVAKNFSTHTAQMQVSLTRILLPSSLHTRDHPNSKQNNRPGHNVMLRDMHEVRQISHTHNQDQIPNGINSK